MEVVAERARRNDWFGADDHPRRLRRADRLGHRLPVRPPRLPNNHISHIDLRHDTAALTEVVELKPGQPFFLRPLEFALGVTVEHIVVPDDLVARLDGKSSLGRVGLLIHATAGLVDPGWEGRLTLELMNLAPFPITLFAGMKIGQISFIQMTSPVDTPYGQPARWPASTRATPTRPRAATTWSWSLARRRARAGRERPTVTGAGRVEACVVRMPGVAVAGARTT